MVNDFEQDWYWRIPTDSVGVHSGEWRQMNQSSSLAMVLPIQGVYCFIIVRLEPLYANFFLEASLHGTESFGCCTKVFMIISNSIFTGFLVVLLHSGY